MSELQARKDILQAVNMRLGHAEDDHYRANLAFNGADLTVQHGQSGKTRGEILREYEEELARWKRAVALAEKIL